VFSIEDNGAGVCLTCLEEDPKVDVSRSGG
jgi:hypothetical protein